MTATGAGEPAQDVGRRVGEVRQRVRAAAARAGRRDSVELVAVTKGFPAAFALAALDAGADAVAENRAQELLGKASQVPALGAPGAWHFVGRLQRNKVARLAPLVSVWHSVDRSELAAEIARRAPEARTYVQVNVSGEEQKGGCPPADAPALVDEARRLGLVVLGLMTVPPAGTDPRPFFASLHDLAGRCEVTGLSMGMSGDFEAAVEEGATVIRVGSALFGERPR